MGIGTLNVAGLANQASLSIPTTIADFGSSQLRNLTGVTAANASTLAGQAFNVAVTDTAANLSANMDSLQTLLTGGQLSSVAVSDGGAININAAQAANDAGVLSALSGAYSVNVSDTQTNILANQTAIGKLLNLNTETATNASSTGTTTVEEFFNPTAQYSRIDTSFDLSGNLIYSLDYTNNAWTFAIGPAYGSVPTGDQNDSNVSNTFIVNNNLAAGMTITGGKGHNTYIIGYNLPLNTTIQGGAGPNLLQVTNSDISQATIKGNQTLEIVSGNVNMTVDQINQLSNFGTVPIICDTPTATISVTDTALNIQNGLQILQSLASHSRLSSVSITDGGFININASQAANYASALNAISNPYSVNKSDTKDNNASITYSSAIGSLKNLNTETSTFSSGAENFTTEQFFNPNAQYSRIDTGVDGPSGNLVYTLDYGTNTWTFTIGPVFDGFISPGDSVSTVSNIFNVSNNLASGTTIKGGSGAAANLLKVTNSDISLAQITGIQTLEVNGYATLTALQLTGSGGFTGLIGDASSNTLKAFGNGTYSLANITSGIFNLDASNTTGTVTLIGGNQAGETLTAGTGVDTITTGNGASTTVNAIAGDTVNVGGNGQTGTADVVNMSGTSAVTSAVNVFGGSNVQIVGSNDGVWVNNHGTNINVTVSGSNDQVGLGAGSTLTFTSGSSNSAFLSSDTVNVNNTGAALTLWGNYDTINANSDTIYLGNGSASDTIIGSNDSIWAYSGGQNISVTIDGSNDQVGLNAGSSVTDGSVSTNNTVYLSNDNIIVKDANSSLTLWGSGDSIDASVGNVTINLANGGVYDTLTGSNDSVWAYSGGQNESIIVDGSNDKFGLNANSSVTINSGSTNTVYMSNDGVKINAANSVLAVWGSSNTITANSDTINLDGSSTQSNIINGNSNSINVAVTGETLYLGNGSTGDTITGNSENIYAYNGGMNISATVQGSNDQIGLNAGSSVTMTDGNNNTADLNKSGETATMNGIGEWVNANGDIVNFDPSSTGTVSGSGNTVNAAAGDTVTIASGSNSNLLEADASGNDSFANKGGAQNYQFGATFGQDTIDNLGGRTGGSAQGEVDFLSGVTKSNLWFQQSGSDLLVELLGTSDQIDIAGWFVGGNAGAEVTAFKTTADTNQLLNSQVQSLVTAMAAYSSNHSSFNVATATTIPTDNSNLNNHLSTAWAH